MLEHIVIVVIVLIAALYVLRGLRRSLSGRSACEQEGCGGCPFADTCSHDHKPATPIATNETEPRS
jgi:hypothetical protein